MSTKKIHDEFTDLPISRQRKWQLRRLAKGRCILCGEPLATKNHCLRHAVGMREHERQVRACRRRIDSLTYRLEKKPT